jgi:AraC-like DNA-binding protein
MARPKKELPSRSAIVPAVVRRVRSLGLDVDALSWRFALPGDAAERDEVRAPAGAADELMQVVVQSTGEDDVALRVAGGIDGRAAKLVDLLVRSGATVRAGAATLARAVRLLQEGLEASLEEERGEGARFVLRTPRRPRGLGRHVHEVALAHAIDRLRQGAGEVAVGRAWFSHPRPARIDALLAFFGTHDLSFGCEDSGFSLPRASLDLLMPAADTRTIDAIRPLVDAEINARPEAVAFAERVAAHVRNALPGGADVAEVAEAMHMSPRTLQRRLEDEETRFGEVLDRARLERAQELLADPDVALIDVAFRLGFSDLATFSRAFKRWTGMPPGQWRRS